MKKRGRETTKAKGRNALPVARHRSPTAAYLQKQLDQRTRELAEAQKHVTEALEQQTATSEVLQIISSSPGELGPVFKSMLANAIRLCGATFGSLGICEGDAYRMVALHNAPAALAELRAREPLVRPGPASSLVRSSKTKQVVQIADLMTDPGYTQRDPVRVALVELGGARSALSVPMLKENTLIGVFNVYRQQPGLFSEKQIDLVSNFAKQAVIAIENARLLNELRQRTADLSESLQQQTATSEVLQVISSSPGELEPVFSSILAIATRLCQANFGNVYLRDGESFLLVAAHNTPSALVEARKRDPSRFGPKSALGQMAREKSVVHIVDLAAAQSYIERDPRVVASVELGGIRTVLTVPMLKENELIGALSIYRQEVQPFTEKQIELVKNFAAQAVIAIENTRLLNELRQRTDDLTESLEQQTATSEVLQVISRSPGELAPIFETMLANATRICGAKFGNLYLHERGALRIVASHDVPPAFAEARRRRGSWHPPAGGSLDEVIRTKQTVQKADLAATQAYAERHPAAVEAVELGGVRTTLQVPMLKDNEVVGVIAIFRQDVRPFTAKQAELVGNFAAQAVIAIENTRLLNELRESYGLVREQAGKLEAQSQELLGLNQQLEQRVADQVGEIERMGRLRRFLPPQVADLIVASGTERQLESHRREITALFCDLRGFTGFSESSDPEDVMALLREYHAAIGEIIIKYSGTLERFAGDGVMVVFNDPVPVPNPALQAVQMALDMRAAIGALIDKWRQLGHDLGFGIGISHGFATLGTIGFEGRFDYAAIGTVSNVASRLCDEAKPGQILISPRVLMAVKEAVTAEPVGEFTLKGISRPMAAYNVLGCAQSEKLN